MLAVPASDAALQAWADAHGLRLTDENRDLVRRHVHRVRLLRTLGGVAVALVPYGDRHPAPTTRRCSWSPSSRSR
jgi:hypothetical protein